MPKRNAEPELTTTQIRELIDMARKTSASMSSLTGRHQALALLDTFNLADRVYGLWPDSSRPGGYAYSILKGELGSDAMRQVAANSEIYVAGVFQESEQHAELTRGLYEGLELSRDNNEAYFSA